MTQFLSTQWTLRSTVAAIALLLAACGKGQQAAAPPTAADKPTTTPAGAVVDGTPISREAYDEYPKGLLRGQPATNATAGAENQILHQLINMQLIADHAEQDGMDNDPE